MKNIVDSCAWLAYFADEKNAQIFAEPIEDIENLIVSTVVLIEVFKVIYRQTDENTALQAISHIQQGKIVPYAINRCWSLWCSIQITTS